jgi:hypothetical protein
MYIQLDERSDIHYLFHCALSKGFTFKNVQYTSRLIGLLILIIIIIINICPINR